MDGGGAHPAAGRERHTENERELRLALAMRGGASLAVWIGGAVAEIDELRRATAEPREHPWAKLAGLAGYDQVSVDVLAGASAGGLNATLLSASIVYGMPFADMRGLWVRLADLEAMSRAVPRFWQPRPDSLLAGDAYFRAELARLITERVPPAEQARDLGDRLDLLLTATLLDPVLERHFDARSGSLLEQRRTASFHFRHRGRSGQPLSDFGTGKDFPATALQLAEAARATSSFPFAFEPAQVHSGTGAAPPGEPDMFGVFSETATDSRAFRVIDGGVLDNIPVTAAIREMAAVPTERPSTRWLLYLNPEPEVAPEGRGSQLALPVASTALRARMSQESLLADLDALEWHNRAVQRTELRRRSVFAPLLAAEPVARQGVLLAQAAEVQAQNAVVRAELDAQAVLRLLTEPAGTEDGKLLPPVVGDPLAGWSPQAGTRLDRELSGGLARRAAAEPGAVFDDVRGLLSGVQECLDWARDAERWADREQLPVLGACKTALYRLRTFGEVLEGHADRYWINGARMEPIVAAGELADWVQRVAERRDRLQRHLPSPVRPLLGAVLAEVRHGKRFQRALEDFAGELMSIVDSSGADAVPHDPDGVDAVAEAHAVLHGIADRISTAVPPRAHVEAPAQCGYDLLERTDRRPETLRALVVLTAPLDVGRVPGDHINFLRVVSDAPSALPFEALARGDASELRVADKVRGGDLGNFGAFLSARWRANDWMWGRLDAASALTELLVAPQRLVRHNADLGASGLAERFRAIVTTPTRQELGEAAESEGWRDFLGELWSKHADQVRAELTALFDAPDQEHALTSTKALVNERLHWTIAARELPFVGTVATGADPGEPQEPDVPEPQRLGNDVRRYAVGRQRVGDLGERRTASIAIRSGLIAYRAVRPGSTGVLRFLGRWAMTLVKPLLMAVVLAIAAPRRAALVAFLGAGAVGLTGIGGAVPGVAGHCSPLPLRSSPGCAILPGRGYVHAPFGFAPFQLTAVSAVAFLLAAVFALWLGYRLMSHGHGLGRWVPACFVAAALVAVLLWAANAGFRLGPTGVAGVAVVLTWLAALGYRASGRLLAAVLSAAVFAVAVLVVIPRFGDTGWLLPTTLVAAYAQMVLLSSADLLRPRPRPERSEGESAPPADVRASAPTPAAES